MEVKNILEKNIGKEVEIDMNDNVNSIFTTLNSINLNQYVEQKNGLNYLSWASAWQEVKKRYPDANYEIVVSDNGLPYVYDEKTGYMCHTRVTINGLTHEMWLPVLDYANNAMKAEPYEIQTKYKKVTVQAATMFDINKSLLRCVTKNIALFGLGLYVFRGEDFPEADAQTNNTTQTQQNITAVQQKNPATIAPMPAQSKATQHPVQTATANQATPKKNWVSTKSFGDRG